VKNTNPNSETDLGKKISNQNKKNGNVRQVYEKQVGVLTNFGKQRN